MTRERSRGGAKKWLAAKTREIQMEDLNKIRFLNARFGEEGLQPVNEEIEAFKLKYPKIFEELGDRVEILAELPVFRRKNN